MKIKLTIALSLCIAVLSSYGQLNMPATTTTPATVNSAVTQAATPGTTALKTVPATPTGGVGVLLSQLTQNISSGALTDDFNRAKGSFTTQAQSAKDVKTQSTLLQKLEAGLKSTAFTSGWAAVKTKWLSGVKTANTTSQLAGYLKTLSDNLNTSALSPTWAKIKPTFTAELQKLTTK